MFDAFLNNIRRVIAKNPEAPALVTQDGVMTFAELGRRAAGVYQTLTGLPAGPALIIGHKEPDCIAAMLACAWAARPFVFVDRATPEARVMKIARLVAVSHVLVAQATPLAFDMPVLALPQIRDHAALPDFPVAAAAELPFYIIFTSGSTGEPKGVPISRGNYAALHGWYAPLLDAVDPAGAHVNHANFAFDMGMFDLWPALALGRPVVLLNHANNINPRNNIRHLKRCAEAAPSSWASTPSLLQLMCSDAEFSHHSFPDLRWFVVGGEMLPRPLVLDLMQRFPKARILNGYGPSEATCATHLYALNAAEMDGNAPLSVGPAIAPNRMRIVDQDGEPMPIGAEGELELSGPQVIRHYLPVTHPANAALGWRDGQRSYRTGDLGRIDADGNLTLLGRIDRQVKWLGNRIELNEIERIADEFAPILKSVCLPRDEAGRVTDILLFLELRAGAQTTRAEVLTHLARFLPNAMLPRDLRFVAQLPVTLNGKLDRQKLLEGAATILPVPLQSEAVIA